MVAYHDEEWGVPEHDDRRLFEFLILEGAQAGLSWITILRKRENYRKAFDRFNPKKMVRYDSKKIQSLLKNEGIIRNRLKIESAISNAKAYFDDPLETGADTIQRNRLQSGDKSAPRNAGKRLTADLRG